MKLVICFSTSAFDAPIWTNKQHLMSRLSKREGYKVFYIDQGMSSFYLKQAVKNFDIKYFFFPVRKVNSSLFIFSPYFLPLLKGSRIKRVSWSVLFFLFAIVKKIYNSEKVIYWVYQPQAWYFIRKIRKTRDMAILYDCVDEFATQPFYSKNEDAKNELYKIEELLCRKSDVVTTTSKKLFEDKKVFNSNTYYVHNVGDFDHFKYQEKYNRTPNDFPSKDHRIKVLYAGVIDDYKTDLQLVLFVAKMLYKTHHFIFVGPIRVSNNEIFSSLEGLNNVSFLGQKDYSEVPFYLHNADHLWLPYLISTHTNRVFPLKLFEYMATGKAIIVRNLESIGEYNYLFNVFEKEEEVIEIFKKLGTTNKNKSKMIHIAGQNTWETRLNRILSYVESDV